MLADRPYMRDRVGRTSLPVSVLLMIVLVIIFAVQCVNDVYFQTALERWLPLTSESLTHGYLWQLVTFQFLHGSVLHLVCNLLGLWYFGRFVEALIGWRRFLLAYFGCGVVGGILQSVLMTSCRFARTSCSGFTAVSPSSSPSSPQDAAVTSPTRRIWAACWPESHL